MSDTSAFPNGYTCGGCGQFVGWNIDHDCAGRARFAYGGGAPAPTLRQEVETAHRHVQNAQRIAYSHDAPPLRWGVRLALNRAETLLIRLLVHKIRPR